MDGVNVNVGSGSAGSTGSSGSTSSDSTADLQSAFDTAIQQARETLEISTKGNAELNALRARPQ